ncbi:MAG: site-2 protease family protein [Anaerolineae bacterium]|nr:site-2 protease family protein [Anaerolineae bacterium]
MDSSLRLFSIRGIAIRVHITFPLILIWAALQFGFLNDAGWTGALFGVIVILFLFVIVTLHELGHSVAAQRYDVPVKQIVLLPIGGVAQLDHIPESPWQEFVIAIAGPAVNFVLAVFLGALLVLPGVEFVGAAEFTDLSSITLPLLFSYIFAYNLFLGVFNLLPAFPMDGGRILRALLAARMDYLTATRWAVRVGQGLAWVLGLYGFTSGNFFLILIAFFIYMGAGQEGQLVQLRTMLRGVTVEQAFSRQVNTLRPSDTLHQAVVLTLRTLQSSFPILQTGRLVGILPYQALVEALDERGPSTPVGDVMVRDVEPVSPRDELFDVQQRLQTSRLDSLPVMDGDQLLGVITTRDISELYRLMAIDPDILPGRAWRPQVPYSPHGTTDTA